MTPRLLDVLAERHRDHEQREDLRTGQIAYILANVNRKPDSAEIPLSAFVPGLREPESKDQTPEVQFAFLKALGLVTVPKEEPGG